MMENEVGPIQSIFLILFLILYIYVLGFRFMNLVTHIPIWMGLTLIDREISDINYY